MLTYGDIFVNLNETPNYFGHHEGRHTYRLEHFYRCDPYQQARSDNFYRKNPHLSFLKDEEKSTKTRLVMCSRSKAEYVSGCGVSGCIVKIEDIKVVGTVRGRWSKDTYSKMKRNATNRAILENTIQYPIGSLYIDNKTGRIL